MKTINISNINADFTEDTEPKDEYLIQLLGQAYKGDINCYKAVIKLEAINPYLDFKPEISEEYRKHFLDAYKKERPHALYVYERDGRIIMSDDYKSYYLYKEVGATEALCIVVGEIEVSPDVLAKSEPFKLPLPSVEMI